MIPNYVRHASFRGLARYLVTGRAGGKGADRPERVSWMSYRNIDPEMPWQVATAICESTVRTSQRRCKDPTLHFMWSPSPSDRPLLRQEWERIADRTLAAMGLEGHQALIVEHNDASFKGRPRPHLHMMVNAVNEEGRPWRKPIEKPDPTRKPYVSAPGDSFWKTRLDRLARAVERDYGLQRVETPIAAYWEGREWERPRSRRRAEHEIDQRTGRLPEIPMAPTDVKTLGRQVKGLFVSAKSWDELQSRLNEDVGVHLKAKGQGLILQFGDGHYAKLSGLGKMKLEGQERSERLSKDRLAKAFGETFEDYWQREGHAMEARLGNLKAHSALTPPEREPPIATESASDTASARAQERGDLEGRVVPERLSPRQVEIADRPFRDEQKPMSIEDVIGLETEPAVVGRHFDHEKVETYRKRMGGALSRARSWARIEHIAQANGLRIAGGWALHDGARYLNMSVLDGLDLKRRAQRCGESFSDFRARRLSPDQARLRRRQRDRGHEFER